MKCVFSLFFYLLLCLTFVFAPEALAEEEIYTLDVTITEPKTGEHPDFSFECTPSDGLDMDCCEIFWSQLEPTEIEMMDADDTFVHGGVYMVDITLSVSGEEIWFADELTVTVNRRTVEGVSDSSS